MEQRREVVQGLDNILQFLDDSALCFKKHVTNTHHAELKNVLKDCYLSRKKMILEIQDELEKLGEKKLIHGTVLGKLHFIFENIKSFIKKGDALAISKEVRRGESVLIDYYKQALKLPLSATLRMLLIKHLSQIEDEIKKTDIASVK